MSRAGRRHERGDAEEGSATCTAGRSPDSCPDGCCCSRAASHPGRGRRAAERADPRALRERADLRRRRGPALGALARTGRGQRHRDDLHRPDRRPGILVGDACRGGRTHADAGAHRRAHPHHVRDGVTDGRPDRRPRLPQRRGRQGGGRHADAGVHEHPRPRRAGVRTPARHRPRARPRAAHLAVRRVRLADRRPRRLPASERAPRGAGELLVQRARRRGGHRRQPRPRAQARS